MKTTLDAKPRVCPVRAVKGVLHLVLAEKTQTQKEQLVKLLPAGWEVATVHISIVAHRAVEAIQVGEAAQVTDHLWGLKIADESERGWRVKVMQTKTKL